MAKQTKRQSGNYTGGQYRGGRTKGEKNLKRVDGGFQNVHGVVFSEAEKKALTTAVNTANRKRARMMKEEGQLPRMVGGKPTGDTLAQSLQTMKYESDFILAPKSKSLQRFKTRADFENYMDNLRRVNQRGYIDQRTEQYRENYIKAAQRNLAPEDADAIAEKLRNMSLKEYRQFVASNEEDLEIYYLYSEAERAAKTNVIRSALGMDESSSADEGDYLTHKPSLKERAAKPRRK